MDWDKLKKTEESKLEVKTRITELRTRGGLLHQECQGLYKKFDELSTPIRKEMEDKAIRDFKKYFEDKGFTVNEDSKKLSSELRKISATYGEANIMFNIYSGFAYGIYLNVEKEQNDCKVFNIEIAKEFDGKYKQLLIEEIKDDSTIEFAENQIKKLEFNKDSIERLINDIDKIIFVFVLDRHYSGMDGEFTTIEGVLNTLETRD